MQCFRFIEADGGGSRESEDEVADRVFEGGVHA